MLPIYLNHSGPRFRCPFSRSSFTEWPTTFRNVIRFPPSQSLRQRLYDLNEPLCDIITKWNDGVHSRVAFQAMMLHSLCRDEEWRIRFVKKGGLDYLLQMLFCDAIRTKDYEEHEDMLIGIYAMNTLY